MRSVSEKDWDNIYRNGNPELMNIFNLNDYLQKLIDTQYTILLSGYGNQVYLSQAEESLLKDLGVDVKFEGNNAWTLSAVISKDNKTVETNAELSRLTGKIEALNYDVFSSYTNYENQTFASVKINDTEMSRNKKGLNFVIIDNNTNKVIDSVNFDITEKMLQECVSCYILKRSHSFVRGFFFLHYLNPPHSNGTINKIGVRA